MIWVKKWQKNIKKRVPARGGEKLSSCQQQMHKKEVFKLVGDKLEKKSLSYGKKSKKLTFEVSIWVKN